MENSKKAYTTPELIIHGDVEEITLTANAKNADLPMGNDGTAFPVS